MASLLKFYPENVVTPLSYSRLRLV